MASGYPDYSGQTNPEVDFNLKRWAFGETLLAGSGISTSTIITGKFYVKTIRLTARDLNGAQGFYATVYVDDRALFTYQVINAYLHRSFADEKDEDKMVTHDLKHNYFSKTYNFNSYINGSLKVLYNRSLLPVDSQVDVELLYSDLTS
jgi:hypothetical protein